MKKNALKDPTVTRDEAGDETVALTAAQLGNMLIDNTPMLDTDDALLFRNVCAALLDELPPQSILDQIDANDLAYNLVAETRCRRAIVATHEGGRLNATKYKIPKIKKELREKIISGPDLETLHKLAKLEENYGRNRRAIAKEWRARADNRTRLASSSPAQPLRIPADQTPSLAPDREQMDGGVNQDGN
jgi:hypothetical protein